MTNVEDLFRSKDADDLDDLEPEASPKDVTEGIAQMVARNLEATGLIEIVEVHASEETKEVHYLGRVKSENEKKFLDTVVEECLKAMENTCDGFIGKQFMRRNGKKVFGWVFSFASQDLKAAAQAIIGALEHLMPKRREVMEAPLVGDPPPQSGGRSSGRRGASVYRG
jgi:hypothetical protein